jgi:hypothetical protein
MFDRDSLKIDVENPTVRQMLARQAMEAMRLEVFQSYFSAVDQYHGGIQTDNIYAEELQEEKSEFARAEYPLIPFFWIIRNDDDSIFQEMLTLDKIDPDTGNHPVINQRSRLNGLHIIDGRILVAIFNAANDEVWRNEHFSAEQSHLLFRHAREIEATSRE